MGSFYSTCAISGLTLTQQPTVRFLLTPTMCTKSGYDTRDHFKSKGLMMSNWGCQGAYTLFGFPIRGNYDDYGQLEDIVEDDGVKMLEAYFNLTLEQIMNCVTSSDWMGYDPTESKKAGEINLDEAPYMKEAKNIELLKTMTCMDVRASVYDELATKGYINDYWFKQNYDMWLPGFLDKVDAAQAVRVSEVKLHPYDDIPDEAVERLLALPMFKDRTRKEVIRLMEMAQDPFASSDTRERCFIAAFRENNMFDQLFPWMRREHEPIITGMWRFICALYPLRKLLMPSAYGSQEYNWKETIAFNEMVNRVAQADLKEFGYEYEDEDEE